MLDVFNFPTPQQSNYQEFYGGVVLSSGGKNSQTWVKPRGVSMVRFMLIGGGAGGANGDGSSGGNGGGSGAVTSWIGPAMFVPNILTMAPSYGGAASTSGSDTIIYYVNKSQYTLLRANGGLTGGTGGTAMTANAFTASGIFTSTAGQAGQAGGTTGAGGNVTASATTFLSGGSGGAGGSGSLGGSVTPNYGYPVLAGTTAGGTTEAKNGYFITQPILVGCGGAGGSTSTTVGTAGGRGGLGCGGGGGGEDSLTGGRGGSGAIFVWAW